MKKLVVLLSVFCVLTGCNDRAVKTPEKLIDQDQMVEIIYDLSLLDALKAHGYGPIQNYPTAAQLLKKKYNVDSLTFAENSKYYAADVKNYKKMYDQVRERLNQESTKMGGGAAAVNAYPEGEGIVK